MYEYNAAIDRIIDGDTVVAVVDLGFRVYHALTLRLVGIDAPELSVPEERERATRAATYLRDMIYDCDDKVIIKTVQDIRAHDKADGFGRYLATLYHPNGKDLNAAMVEAGYAKPWKPKP